MSRSWNAANKSAMDAYYLIASFADASHPELRAFKIVDRLVEEVELIVK